MIRRRSVAPHSCDAMFCYNSDNLQRQKKGSQFRLPDSGDATSEVVGEPRADQKRADKNGCVECLIKLFGRFFLFCINLHDHAKFLRFIRPLFSGARDFPTFFRG